jgi:hypothetical protein
MPGAMGWLDLIVFLLKPTAPGHDLATCSAAIISCGAINLFWLISTCALVA